MVTDNTVLDQAISFVDQERSYLREERRAFERFRERVRLASPDSANFSGASEATEQLLSAYREEVMEALDHETIYDDTLAESLEAELSPAIADLLVSNKPLTQRHKRNLLLETTAAIERREEFCAELADEWAVLKQYTEELEDIKEVLEQLPACSASEQHIERLLIIWEVYDTLLEQCEQLLERRQQQIREAERSVRIFGENHARNEFLYSELDTRYPVLSVIATTCDRIEGRRNGEKPLELPE